MESKKILALIPARGGSKGILRKNLLMLHGKPAIAYSIQQALNSSFINRVIVSTDDKEIAAVAREYGAETPFIRPAEFAQDLSPDIDVFRHTLTWLEKEESYIPELVVHLRPSGPVRRVELIDSAIQDLLSHPEADALRSVAVALQTPYKMWFIDKTGHLTPILKSDNYLDPHSMPRQLLPMVYWQNGYVDVIRPRAILEKGTMWGDCAIPFIIQDQLFELDYPENIPDVERALGLLIKGEIESASSIQKHPV